jgi:hypothetical protein
LSRTTKILALSVLLIIFGLGPSIIYPQNISTDMIKYWFYRNRLNNYFVVPGGKHGESQIVCIRNLIPAEFDPTGSKNIDFGQHGKYTGLYIGVLATEWYLLNKNNQHIDATKTYQELVMTLNAVKQYWDSNAEPFYGEPDEFNGFFIRGNVPCDFLNSDSINHPNGYTSSGESHLKLMNRHLSINDVFNTNSYTFGNLPRGHPGYIDHRTAADCLDDSTRKLPPFHREPKCEENHQHDPHPESMSQDEAIWIMLGCDLTTKLVGGNIGDMALQMKTKILRRLTNIDAMFGVDPFTIYEPNNSVICEDEGGNTRAYGKPLCELFYSTNGTNNPYQLPYSYSFTVDYPTWAQKILWAGASLIPTRDFDLTCSLAAMTDSWNNTGSGIYTISSGNNCETFYTLLWEVLQQKQRTASKQSTILTKTKDQLDSGPCNGPYCYKPDDRNYMFESDDDHWILVSFDDDGIYAGDEESPSNYGWSSTYKWCKDKNEQNHGDYWSGNYNGTDYMLLYNLYHIINYPLCPYYVNYVDRNLAGNLPIKDNLFSPNNNPLGNNLEYYEVGTNAHPINFVAFNTLSSTQTIGLQTHPIVSENPGNVTYVAGTSIHLIPGFHATEGCYFHAFIDEIHCNGSKADSYYPNNMYTPYFDSLISQPKTPYDLEVEDTSGINNLVTMECPVDTLKFMGLNGDTIDEYYTYYWDFGNGITSTEVDPQVYYEPGTYNFSLALTDTNGVSDTMKLIVVVPDCGTQTGLEEQTSSSTSSTSNGGFYVVPNPNNGQMTLVSKNIINYGSSFLIYDMTGRVVYKKQLTEKHVRVQINTEDLENGVYLYALISEQGKLLAKDKLVIIN